MRFRRSSVSGARALPATSHRTSPSSRPTSCPWCPSNSRLARSVVLYRDPDLGVEVLHRVTRLEGDRLVLKGDSNDFLDDARPTAADVEGSLWFSVPYAGFAAWMREPLHAAFLVFVLTLLALAGSSPSSVGSRGEASRR